MKLLLSAPTDKILQLDIQEQAASVVRQLTLNDAQIQSLQHLCESYQATINQSNPIDVLYTIGYQLFALLNQQSDLIGRWLNHVGKRQLELNTPLAPNLLQRVLLDLPWEIMADSKKFFASDTLLYEVVRRVGEANPAAPKARYKDMTLTFMAADPDFNSGLNYENEERAILRATRKARNLSLWVEESGNLDCWTQRIVESGHCDMAHISCHGGYNEQLGFFLQLEDDRYRPQNVTASELRGLAQHIQCLFLSACHTAEVANTPAFAMELAKTGIANVIGWDGSVSDEDATVFAAQVYHALLQQATVPFACAAARQHLLQEHLRTGNHPHWHLGRVYLSPDGGWPLIDSSKPPSPKRRGKSFHELLDRKKNEVPVASKETFVGRRKQTKESLRAFEEHSAAGILLTGIGGTGKSSLAARIVHRMEPQYKAAIIYKDYSEAAILGELKQFIPSDSRNQDFPRYLADIQQNPDLFADNLVEILEEHLYEQPIILVVDDLEQHALETLITASEADGKVGVKPVYQNALRGVIDAFGRADTQSHLILTSRHSFRLLDDSGQDLAEQLLKIEVPDMNPVEQEKHWLALLQSGVVKGVRDEERDRAFLGQIWAICQGNPGLQDVLYQPLLKGEYTVLQGTLDILKDHHVGLGTAEVTGFKNVDKYLQRIALKSYHDALAETERQCLRVLSLFDFPVPEELIIQAGTSLGIEDAQAALQRLDNFGLLTHWQGEGLEGHISCYGLARKITEPLSKEDRHFISIVCAPLLWHIWFSEFLQAYAIPRTETLRESIMIIYNNHFPHQYEGELPLQSHQEQERLAHLHRLCIENSPANWEELSFGPSEFIDSFELSLSLHTFEKLRIAAAAVDGLSHFQWSELLKVFSDERRTFKELTKEHPEDIIILLLKQFGGRPQLLTKGYQINFGGMSNNEKKFMESITIHNEEDRHLAGIQLAKTKLHKAKAYGNYAVFLKNQKQDYAQAEVMYQRAIEADPKDADILGYYALFLKSQKQDYAQAEVMYQRAIEADPKHANNLNNYAVFLENQKDYAQAEVMYQRALEADPKNANNLGNYAKLLFVTNQQDKARQCLEKSESQLDLQSDLKIELAFYRYAHCPPHALFPLKQQLQAGSRSIGWNLNDNVNRACEDGHPHPKMLATISKVISGEQDITSLNQYPEWKKTP